MKSVVEELAALRVLDVAALVARYSIAFGRAPRTHNRETLYRKLAWRVQEQRLGGLPFAAKTRLDELIGELSLPETPVGSRDRHGLHVGSVLTREWKGATVRCVVRVDGEYECDGRVFTSLSAVARHVTGSAWSGTLFFGLKERKRG